MEAKQQYEATVLSPVVSKCFALSFSCFIVVVSKHLQGGHLQFFAVCGQRWNFLRVADGVCAISKACSLFNSLALLHSFGLEFVANSSHYINILRKKNVHSSTSALCGLFFVLDTRC